MYSGYVDSDAFSTGFTDAPLSDLHDKTQEQPSHLASTLPVLHFSSLVSFICIPLNHNRIYLRELFVQRTSRPYRETTTPEQALGDNGEENFLLTDRSLEQNQAAGGQKLLSKYFSLYT